MSASRAELEARVENERKELRNAVQELQVASLQTVSAGHWVARRPYLIAVGAFAVGFCLGMRRWER